MFFGSKRVNDACHVGMNYEIFVSCIIKHQSKQVIIIAVLCESCVCSECSGHEYFATLHDDDDDSELSWLSSGPEACWIRCCPREL